MISADCSACWWRLQPESRCRFRCWPIFSYRTGAPSIRTENGQLVGFVFVDITSTDINGYVKAASHKIDQEVKFPPGYYIQWAGQFQYLQAAEKRLSILIPFTLLIIFVLIYYQHWLSNQDIHSLAVCAIFSRGSVLAPLSSWL